MNQRFFSIAIVLLIISSALAILASSGWTPQGNPESQRSLRAHILTGTDNTWISDGASYSGISTSWQNGSLTTGQNVWFTSAHVGSCTWNNSLGVSSFGSFIIRSGAITITQAASFSVTSYSQAAGTFTGAASYTLTVTSTGSLTQTGGTISSYSPNLFFDSGPNSIWTSSALYLRSLTVNADVTIVNNDVVIDGIGGLSIGSGKTLTINSGKILLDYIDLASVEYSNLGIIAGSGTFVLNTKLDKNYALGTINCPLEIVLKSNAAADRTWTLSTNTVLGSTLLVDSAHASYIMTLNLNATDPHTLSAAGITIGTRGIITVGTSTITDSGNWDSSAGSFVRGTSTVTLTGTTKTLKTQTTLPGFNNLGISGTYTLQSHIWAKNLTVSGTITQATYRMNATTSLSATGSWNGNIYLNGTATSYTVPIIAPFAVGGFIYSQVATTFTNSTHGNLVITPPASTYARIHITRIYYTSTSPTNAVMFNCSLSSGIATFTMQAEPSWYYKVYAGGSLYLRASSTAGGLLSWTYSAWSVKFFNISGTSTFPSYTSSPLTSIYQDHAYTYTVTTSEAPDTWSHTTNATWTSWGAANHTVYGRPSNLYSHKSFYSTTITTYGNVTEVQNYTITVNNIKPVFTTTPTTYIYGTGYYYYNCSFNELSVGGGFVSISTDYPYSYSYDGAGHLQIHLTNSVTSTWNITVTDNTGALNGTQSQIWYLTINIPSPPYVPPYVPPYIPPSVPPAPTPPSTAGAYSGPLVFTAWASLMFLSIATVGLISLWRAAIYIWDITEATAEKAADYTVSQFKGGK